MNFVTTTLTDFDALSDALLTYLRPGEALTLSLAAEDQHYLRFNDGRVRQSTEVEQHRLTLRFQACERQVASTFDLTGTLSADLAIAGALLERARTETATLPPDPFVAPVQDHGRSEQHHTGQPPAMAELLGQLDDAVADTGFTGLYAAGPQLRATRNSAGLRQVFSTTSFFLDYSLFTVNPEGEHKAVKGLVAGRAWEPARLAASLAASRQQLVLLRRSSRSLAPGPYRVYFAPAAVAALVNMLSWGGVSHGAWKKGDSALKKLIEGEVRLSPQFNLSEDFTLGLTPAFNSRGERAPSRLPVIVEGAIENLLISSRTAREYGVAANGAEASEGLRTPDLAPGSLAEADGLATLGTGVYVSNLHYLNWSDLQNARLTGMTRYACYWVEAGEIVAPIRDLRFDDSLYRIFGTALEALTMEAPIRMETGTYGQRALGGCRMPGLLVRDFRFTL